MGKHSKGLGKQSKEIDYHKEAWGNTVKGWGIMGKHFETL